MIKEQTKTLDECKDEIARDTYYEDWEALRLGWTTKDGLQFLENKSTEAAERYGAQFQWYIAELEEKLKIRDINNATLGKWYKETRVLNDKLEGENNSLRQSLQHIKLRTIHSVDNAHDIKVIKKLTEQALKQK